MKFEKHMQNASLLRSHVYGMVKRMRQRQMGRKIRHEKKGHKKYIDPLPSERVMDHHQARMLAFPWRLLFFFFSCQHIMVSHLPPPPPTRGKIHHGKGRHPMAPAKAQNNTADNIIRCCCKGKRHHHKRRSTTPHTIYTHLALLSWQLYVLRDGLDGGLAGHRGVGDGLGLRLADVGQLNHQNRHKTKRETTRGKKTR